MFQSGQLQFLDIGGHLTPRSMYIYHVNTQGGMVTGFDISPNGQASIFGDSSGTGIFRPARSVRFRITINLCS